MRVREPGMGSVCTVGIILNFGSIGPNLKSALLYALRVYAC